MKGYIQLGANWFQADQIAAVTREGQDEARVFLRGSSMGHKVPLTPQKVMDLLREATR